MNTRVTVTILSSTSVLLVSNGHFVPVAIYRTLTFMNDNVICHLNSNRIEICDQLQIAWLPYETCFGVPFYLVKVLTLVFPYGLGPVETRT